MVQWLGLRASTAGGRGYIRGWVPGIPHVIQGGQKNQFLKINKERNEQVTIVTVP